VDWPVSTGCPTQATLLEAVAELARLCLRVKQAQLLRSQGIGLWLRSGTGKADAEPTTQASGC